MLSRIVRWLRRIMVEPGVAPTPITTPAVARPSPAQNRAAGRHSDGGRPARPADESPTPTTTPAIARPSPAQNRAAGRHSDGGRPARPADQPASGLAERTRAIYLARDKDLVASCLAPHAKDSPDQRHSRDHRIWDSDPRFKAVLTALNQERFAEAVESTEELIAEQPDLYLPYIWCAEALISQDNRLAAASLLLNALDTCTDRFHITCALADLSLGDRDADGFLYWWAQALFFTDSMLKWDDSGPFMHLGAAAATMGLVAASNDFLEMSNRVAYQVCLTAERQASIQTLLGSAGADNQKSYRQIINRIHSERVVPSLGWTNDTHSVDATIRSALDTLEHKAQFQQRSTGDPRVGISHIDGQDFIVLSTTLRSFMALYRKQARQGFEAQLSSTLSVLGSKVEFVGERKAGMGGLLMLWRVFH